MKSILVGGVLLLLAVLSVVPVVADEPVDEDARLQRLIERADAFWQARVGQRLEVCYGMLSEESRQLYSITQYIRMVKVRVLSYEITQVDLDAEDPDQGTVHVQFEASAMTYNLRGRTEHQVWVWENGDWYHPYERRNPMTPAQSEGAPPRARGKSWEELSPAARKQIEEMNQLYAGRRPNPAEAGAAAAPLGTASQEAGKGTKDEKGKKDQQKTDDQGKG